MIEEIKIDEYDFYDRESCIALLMSAFPGTSNEDTFRWRFETPRREKPIIICAKHKHKVISFNSWIPWSFLYNGKKYTGYQSGESATDTAYRRKGIFGNVLKYADHIASEKGVDFFFGFPNMTSYGAFIKNGYQAIGTHAFSVRVVNPLVRLNKDFCVRTGGNEIVGSNIDKTMITPVLDMSYVKWRFEESNKKYLVSQHEASDDKFSFYMRKSKWKNIPEYLLLDFHSTNNDFEYIAKAYQYLDTLLSGKALYIRTFFNFESPRGKVLRHIFPLQINTKFYTLIVKNISGGIGEHVLQNVTNWDIMPHCVDEL